ncbi:hypothetical protein MKEN_01356300 [Mycena kentingensis (nom. inval.)]|nr:hypothetical protein MKEN_01356300 [Mycena kentingensis (nom. inval.)]
MFLSLTWTTADSEDISVEAILDEDDLLQECKAQNTRLIDYFQRVDVLQRLLAYVTGQIEGEPEKGQFKYPYVATEVLCSEIWSIVETCVNRKEELLTPFWESVLDRSPEDMKMQMVMAAHFTKINTVFLSKRPTEMLAFIRAQPTIVERLLQHIETPSFVDLLVRIIQLDEQPGGTGVLEARRPFHFVVMRQLILQIIQWLSSEQLIPRLLALLAPNHTPDMHTVVAELIKGIISMSTPAPGPGMAELHAAPASNLFTRQLASEESVAALVGYMMADFPPPPVEPDADIDALPNRASCTSSVVHSIAIVIELIRKNNSNYFEPYLFHTLRNRLIQVQQNLNSTALDDDGGRDTLEKALGEMVDRMGVVHLGPVLQLVSGRLEALQSYLRSPRSFEGPIPTTVGLITPLTFERYRICELFAELLHCSNMALLNRPPEFNRLYDSEGRLQGGLGALEDLARVIALNNGDEQDRDAKMGSTHDDMMGSEDEPGSSDDDSVTMEELNMVDDPPFPISAPPTVRASSEPPPSPPLQEPLNFLPSSSPVPIPEPSPSPPSSASFQSPDSALSLSSSTTSLRSRASRRSTAPPPEAPPPVGDQFKRRFIELNVASTLLDLFFEFPWNNFLHSSVYDLVHQILTGTVDGGLGRELAISVFRDAQLMRRIVEGQRMNDTECAKPKSVRLGFMGHLTLIAEDVLTALERFPTELRDQIASFAPQPDWDEYVQGRYNETKRRDAELLGGGKPVIKSGMGGGAGAAAARWKVDEADAGGATATLGGDDGAPSGMEMSVSGGVTAASLNGRGEFRRAMSARPRREGSADFGSAPMVEDDDGMVASHRIEYASNPDNFDSDDEDYEGGGGWLSQSAFSLRDPPVSSRNHSSQRRPLASSGFDDAFSPSDATDPFADDGFGPFSDAGADPFTFTSPASGSPSAFSDEMDDASFDDNFADGDFGDFQSGDFGSPPKDGELTPTAGSWTFASQSGESLSPSPREKSLEPEDLAEAAKRISPSS